MKVQIGFLFILFIFGLTTFFSISEYIQQSTIPISQIEYSRSIDTLNFYEDGLLKQKISNYRSKYFNEFKTENFPSEPKILITFFKFRSGFPNFLRASLILFKSKLTIFLKRFLASRLL